MCVCVCVCGHVCVCACVCLCLHVHPWLRAVQMFALLENWRRDERQRARDDRHADRAVHEQVGSRVPVTGQRHAHRVRGCVRALVLVR